MRVLHIDAVWQMRAEYQDAIVHQARVQQAQRVFEDSEKQNKLEDSVKSAMCPFLVLEIRRHHLIEDTLFQIHEKVFNWVFFFISYSFLPAFHISFLPSSFFPFYFSFIFFFSPSFISFFFLSFLLFILFIFYLSFHPPLLSFLFPPYLSFFLSFFLYFILSCCYVE